MKATNLNLTRSRFSGMAFTLTLTVFVAAFLLICSGCGGGGKSAGSSLGGATGSSSSASSVAATGRGQVAFTVHWPATTAAASRLIPVAAKAIKFTVTEAEAPNNVVVLTKTVARPSDGGDSTVMLTGLPTVLVRIQVGAYPSADATGTMQASGTVNVQVPQNQTVSQSVTLDTTIKTVEVTAAAPVTISADGKFSIDLSASTTPDSLKAQLTATAYNAAHDIVLTGLNKWVYTSAKPSVATVGSTSAATRAAQAKARKSKSRTISKSRAAKTRDEAEDPIDGATATVTAVGGGTSALTVTESESGVSKTLEIDVTGSRAILWSQPLADAQNSSCSSGPGAAGNIAGSFQPIPDGDPSGDYDDSSFNQFFGLVESSAGNLAFVGKAIYLSDGGISVYTKSGSKVDHLGGGFGDPQEPTYGPDGTLYAIGAGYGTTGHVTARGPSNWSFDAEFYFSNSSPLTVSGDGATVYAVLSGDLYALDAHTGDKKWQVSCNVPSGGGNLPKPAVSLDNTVVYAGTGAGVTAFDAATGTKLWDSGGTAVAENSYVGVGPTGLVYAASPTSDGYQLQLQALNPVSGQAVWTRTGLQGPFILCRNGTVYAGNFSTGTLTDIVALNGATGATLWTKPTGSVNYGVGNTYSLGGAAAADGTLYVIKAETRDLYNVYRLVALDGASGADKWTLTPNLYTGVGGSGPYTNGSYDILAVGGDGTLYASGGSSGGKGVSIFAIR